MAKKSLPRCDFPGCKNPAKEQHVIPWNDDHIELRLCPDHAAGLLAGLEERLKLINAVLGDADAPD